MKRYKRYEEKDIPLEKGQIQFKDLSDVNKRKVYKKAITSGDVEDTFEGFSKQMMNAIFDKKSLELIEL